MPLSDLDVAANTVEERAPPSHPFPVADLEHPWLGLESFREETRAYFFGRDVEIAEIDLRLRSHPLLLLYGHSGLGKTSILSAGLIPRLTNAGHRPALHRFDYSNQRVGPAGQLLLLLFISPQDKDEWRYESALARARQWATQLREKLAFDLPEDSASLLWLRLHWSKEPPTTTHLILDQFEEVFALGAGSPDAEHEVRDALAILLQGAIPEPISRLIAEEDSLLDQFDPDSMPVRVILALRDDYVYALNRWKSHIPSLGQNNFELGALRGPAAFDAVFKPGELHCKYRDEVNEKNRLDTGLPPIVTEETARRIVRFVAKKGQDTPIEEIEAVPPILSLLCRELNERRFTQPGGTPELPAQEIIFSESDDDVETIIKAFYERCLAGQPEGVRMFIEEALVGKSGARLAQDEKSILSCFEEGWEIPGAADGRWAPGFGDATKARGCLKYLVDERLLSSLGGGENPSYELIHDLLAGVAEKSRIAREERFEKEQADRRAEADRKAREDAEARAQVERERAEIQARATRRARFFAGAAIVVALIAVGACYLALAARSETERQKRQAILQKREAERQRADAVAAKKAAEELINFMQYDLSGTLEKVGRLDMMAAVNSRIRKYHEDHPAEASDLGALREESVSLSQQGDLLSAQGDLAGALKSYHDDLAIAAKLAKQDPGNAGWQRDLSVSYEKVGNVQRAQGDLAGALKSYRDTLAIREKLAKQDPNNAGGQFNLATIHGFIGIALQEQGKLSEALGEYQAYRDLMEQLSKQDPGNAGWQRDLSVSYEKVGNVQSDQDDLAGALKSYRDSLAIREKLSKQDPGNAGWQRDLSISYERVGDVQLAQGDLAGALKSYRDSLAIHEKLSKQDTGNAGWQRDLSVSYINVGYVQRAQGDLAGALKSYRDSLAIHEKLSKQDTGNANWQADLGWIYWQTGAVLEKVQPGSKKEGLAMVQKGHDILHQLKERTGLTVQQQKWLDASETDLGRMREANR